MLESGIKTTHWGRSLHHSAHSAQQEDFFGVSVAKHAKVKTLEGSGTLWVAKSLIFRAPRSHPMAPEPSDSLSLSLVFICIYIYINMCVWKCICVYAFIYIIYIIWFVCKKCYSIFALQFAWDWVFYVKCWLFSAKSLLHLGVFAASFASPRRKNTVQQIVVQCSSADRTTGDRK